MGSDTPIVENGLGKLYMKSDEKYVYFMVDTSDYNFNSDTLYIPIDIKIIREMTVMLMQVLHLISRLIS